MNDINKEMNKAMSKHISMINELIEKTLKRYCEISRVSIEKMKENKSLSREIHPSYESFMHHGVEIFRLEKAKKDFKNEGCYGSETTWTMKELF